MNNLFMNNMQCLAQIFIEPGTAYSKRDRTFIKTDTVLAFMALIAINPTKVRILFHLGGLIDQSTR